MSFLVSAHELARLLEAGGTRVLDVQFALGGPPSIELYAAGHIPGAPHLPLEPALAAQAQAAAEERTHATANHS